MTSQPKSQQPAPARSSQPSAPAPQGGADKAILDAYYHQKLMSGAGFTQMDSDQGVVRSVVNDVALSAWSEPQAPDSEPGADADWDATYDPYVNYDAEAHYDADASYDAGARAYRSSNRYWAERDYIAQSGLLPPVVRNEYGDAIPAGSTDNAFDQPLVAPFVMAPGADAEVARHSGAGLDADAIELGGAEQDVIASAQSQPTDYDCLQLRPDMGPKEREAARLVAVKTCYRPEVIYGDASYFTPAESAPPKLTEQEEALFVGGVDEVALQAQLKSHTVLACAYFSPLVPKISLAFCTYLQEHFPLGNLVDQQRFNIVLLALFFKIREGDICLNLSNLDQLYEIVAQWQESYANALQGLELEDEGPKGIIRTRREDHLRKDNERFLFLVKHYAPRSLAGIHEVLRRSLAVGWDAGIELNAPLVFDQNRLYLRRYFRYEQGIVKYVAEARSWELTPVQQQQLTQGLAILFPPSPEIGGVNWQKVAAAMATLSNFTVISGGPGTGKTTTIMRILLLLICLAGSNRNIQMCAPTGKAAARMGESISKQLKDDRMQADIAQLAQLFGLSSDEINSFLPKSAVTVQGLIKTIPNLATPIYNADHPLNCDVLVVDEVSMLDLALFYKLLMALKPECKLILLGDKDQLASVEAGRVLGDLCARLNDSAPERINAHSLNLIAQLTGYKPQEILSGKIADHVSLLQFSYRSKDVPEIGQLARIVNDNVCVVPEEVSTSEQQVWLDHKAQALEQGDLGAYLEACAQLSNCKVNLWPDLMSDDEFMVGIAASSQAEDAPEEQSEDEHYEQTLRTNLSPIYDLLTKAAHDCGLLGPDELKTTGQKAQQTKALQSGNLPAISLIQLKSSSEQKIKELCADRAKHAVDPSFSDNYAPFLQRLAELNFEISADLHECEELFKLMDRFRLLCSNHSGLLGDHALNEAICAEVKQRYFKTNPKYREWLKEKFFPGQIVIITKNDPVLGLVNGNVGFCALAKPQSSASSSASDLPSASPQSGTNSGTNSETNSGKKSAAQDERILRVFIPVGAEEVDGRTVTKVNAISTLLLTNYDTGYAMSIHKSQGSEYDRVEIMLSERTNRVLTKELVYTGITRAKKGVTLVASNQVLYYSLAHSVERASGLSSRLIALSELEAQQAQAALTLASGAQGTAPTPTPTPTQAQTPTPAANLVPRTKRAPTEGGTDATDPAAPDAAPKQSAVQAIELSLAPSAEPLSEPTAALAVAPKPKRKRRTKAEMEAARAEEAKRAAELAAQGILPKPKRKRRTKAEMEAARAAEAARNANS